MTLKEQIDANSKAWHTAGSQAEKDRLHEQNVQLYSEYDKQNGTNSSFAGGSGTWGTTEAPKYQAPTVNDQSDYLTQMYEAQKKAALSQLQSAYEKNKNAFDRAEGGIAPVYQSARNQAAGQSEQAKRSFAEYAAASGLNSGAGGQAELAQNVTLQNNLNEINTAESAKISDLKLKRADAETDYNNAITQAQANNDFELAKSLYAEKIRVDEAWREQIRYETQQEQVKWENQHTIDREGVSDNRYQDSLKQQELENAYKAAGAGDFSKLDSMGVDTSTLKAQFAAQGKSTGYRGQGGNGGGTVGGTVGGNNPPDPTLNTGDEGTGDQKGMPSLNAKKLVMNFSNQLLTMAQKLDMIQKAYQAGEINKVDADQLLKFIGA